MKGRCAAMPTLPARVELRDPDPADRPAILNLTTFFRYELLPFADAAGGPGSALNAFGVIDEGGGADGAPTHERAAAAQAVWWTKPGVLLPMLIRVGDEPAGFANVARPPHAHRSVDYRIEDFFIANKFRRAGVGRRAVEQIVARHRGVWEVGWLPRNAPAEQFWRAVTRPWTPHDWPVEQSPGTPPLPGLRFTAPSGASDPN
jgi:predicted acetyltransferase